MNVTFNADGSITIHPNPPADIRPWNHQQIIADAVQKERERCLELISRDGGSVALSMGTIAAIRDGLPAAK